MVPDLLRKLGIDRGCVFTGIPALDQLLGTGFPIGHVTTLEFDDAAWEARGDVFGTLNLDLSVPFESPWIEAGGPNRALGFEWEPSPEEFPAFVNALRASNVACILVRAPSWNIRKATKFHASVRIFVSSVYDHAFKFKCVKTTLTARQGHSFLWTP